MMEAGAGSAEWKAVLGRHANLLNIKLTAHQIDQLSDYVRELLQANQSLNLTRIIDPVEILEILLLDSLVPGLFIPKGARVLDLGSGAGLPGIPIKIGYPDRHLTLIDGKRKKVNFLRFVIRQLRLKGIEAAHVRAEALATQTEGFDVVISRAVSSLKDLVALSIPLVRPGGSLMAMKGKGYQDEIAVFEADFMARFSQKPGIDVKHYRLPMLEIDRALVIVSGFDRIL